MLAKKLISMVFKNNYEFGLIYTNCRIKFDYDYCNMHKYGNIMQHNF